MHVWMFCVCGGMCVCVRVYVLYVQCVLCMCACVFVVCVSVCACLYVCCVGVHVCVRRWVLQSLFVIYTVWELPSITFMSSKQSPSSKEASSSMPSTSSVVKVHFRLNTAAYMKIHFLRIPIPLICCCICPMCFLGNFQRNRASISTENWNPRCDESSLLTQVSENHTLFNDTIIKHTIVAGCPWDFRTLTRALIC